MKHSILYLMTAAVLLAGCAKEVDKTQVPEIPAGMHAVTITASVDNPETRTSVEIVNKKGIYSWQENEQIAVVETQTGDKNGILPFQILDQENGTFTGSMTDGESLVFAVTPKGALTEVECTDEKPLAFTLSLSGTYNFSDGTNAVMVAGLPSYAEGSENPHFTFQHAAALYRVVYENVPVGTAALHFVASEKPITGDFIFDSLEGVEILQSDASGHDYADVLLDAPVSSPNTTLTFYVPVPTGTYADVTVSLLDKDLDAANPIANTTRSFEAAAAYPVSKGQIVRIPKITLAPVEITKGKEYILATSSNRKWTAFGSALEWDNMSWTPEKVEGDASAAPGNYSDRGVQFGTNSNGVKSLRFTGTGYDIYCASSTQGISTVDIEVGAKNGNVVTGTVSIGGVSMTPASEGSDAYTAADNAAGVISFTSSTPLLGDIVIDLTLETKGALYVKGITINADNRFDPELAFDPDEYTAVIGSAFTAPTLTAADGFNGTVTYAVSENNDVASVDASTGAVTIGSNAGTVTITASFAGNDTYKTASASYTLTVVEPSLIVNTTTPDPALCAEGAETTFTVTSNVPWSASTEADFITIRPSGEQAASASPVTVTVTFAANTSDESRSAVVSVKPADQEAYSSMNQDVTVTQEKFMNVDVLTYAWTGITGNSYSNWSGKEGTVSGAVYAGNSYAGNITYIQLRNSSPSGIVTTASGGVVRKVEIDWASNTTNGRFITVYGRNTAYEEPADLYNETKRGTSLGTIVKGTSTELTIDDDYAFVGLLASSALYMDEIRITWGTVDPNAPKFGAEIVGSNDIAADVTTGTINVTGNVAWTASADNGATVSPSSGNGEGTITVTMPENESFTDPANYVVTVSTAAEVTPNSYQLTFTQAPAVNPNQNDGTLEKPYNASEALTILNGYTSGQVSSDWYYIRGKISSIDSYNSKYSSITYFISDDGTENNQLEVYSGKNIGNTSFSSVSDLAVGDDVIVYGQLKDYNGTKEIYQNNYLYSLNGKTKVLAAPAVTAGQVGTDKQIKVDWTTVTDATSYMVECGDASYTAQSSETSHTFTVESYDTYAVRVTAKADNAIDGVSAPVDVVVVAPSLTAVIKSGESATNIPATGATRHVTVGGNVAWTASITGGATLQVGTEAAATEITGTGEAEVTVIIPANNDTDNGKEYTFSIATEVSGVTAPDNIVFSQIAKASGGGTQDYTTIWTASSGALGSSIGSGSINTTVSGGTTTQSWSYSRSLISGSSYTGWTSNCIQLGKNGGVENLTISTSNIPGTIKSVSVECSSYQGKHNVSITVGGTTYLSSTATASWTTVSAKSGTGESSGDIVISFTGGTRALYIKSITVVYNN